ncbi:hypothetical protein NIAHE148_21470 [Escherichia coli]|nr:hypothetical protein NIAHE148_21470 [Escherichia coli]BCT63485.1 hypothetical protein NIAHE189_21460 [Escherichia coli]
MNISPLEEFIIKYAQHIKKITSKTRTFFLLACKLNKINGVKRIYKTSTVLDVVTIIMKKFNIYTKGNQFLAIRLFFIKIA